MIKSWAWDGQKYFQKLKRLSIPVELFRNFLCLFLRQNAKLTEGRVKTHPMPFSVLVSRAKVIAIKFPPFNSPNLGRQGQTLLGRGSGQHINFSWNLQGSGMKK